MGPIAKLLLFIFLWVSFLVLTMGLGLLVTPVYWLLVYKNADTRAAKAVEKLQSTLMNTEKLMGSTTQLRLAALLERRAILGITNSRMILVQRSIFGGFKMKDYQWKDLKDAQLEENIIPNWFGSKLAFRVDKSPIVIDGVPSQAASEIYKASQQQEQAWEEKRRIRDLEERRASSGGFVMNSGGHPSGGATAGTVEELRKVKELLDQGVIDDAEFQEMKAKILARG